MHLATLAIVPLLFAGCSMSVFGDEAAAPVVTGSIPATPVEVKGPLPPSLAYSDATRIGQAASAAMMQASGGDSGDWVNNSTGSSGTIEPAGATADAGCRPFSTTVTSIGGVHQYSGNVCQQSGGHSVIQIDERSLEDRG